MFKRQEPPAARVPTVPSTPVTVTRPAEASAIASTEPEDPSSLELPGTAPRLKIAYLAQRYGVSEETIRRWIRQRLIPFKMLGSGNVTPA
jgi:hypothetical protein